MQTSIRVFEQFTKGFIAIISFFPPHVFLSFEGHAVLAIIAGVLTTIGISIVLYSNILNIDGIAPLTNKNQESHQSAHQQLTRCIIYSILNMVIRCIINAIIAFACITLAMIVLTILA